MWISIILFAGWLFWFVIWPNFKKSEMKLKTGMRDFNIKQMKRSIKNMNITKEELFDE